MTHEPSREGFDWARSRSLRDIVVLACAGGPILFAAVALWAGPLRLAQGTVAPGGWKDYPDPNTFILGVLALLLAVGIARAFSQGRAGSSASKGSRQPMPEAVVPLLMVAFAAGQGLELFPALLGSALLEASLITLVAILFVALFFRREELEPRRVIWVGGWVVSLVAERMVIDMITGRIEGLHASVGTQVFLAAHGAVVLVLLLAPFVLLLRPYWLRRVEEWARRIPLTAYAAFFMVAVLAALANNWPNRDQFKVELVVRTIGVAAAFAGSAAALSIATGTSRSSLAEPTRLSQTGYRLFLGAIFATYALLAIRIAIEQREDIGWDGIAYLQAARHYAEGEIPIRGHWSPMISWLIAPAIALGADPIDAIRVFGGIAGAFWIISVVSLAQRMGVSPLGRLGAAAAGTVTALSNAFVHLDPDLLGAGLVTTFVLALAHPAWEARPTRTAMVTGTLAAAAFYAKSYNFPALIVILIATAGWRLAHRRPWAKVGYTTGLSLLVLFLLALPWMLLLQSRYGRFTYAMTGSINHAAGAPGESFLNPCLYHRPCAREGLLIPWEDPLPSDYSGYRWDPLASVANLRHQLSIIGWSGLQVTGLNLFAMGPLPPLAFLALVLVWLVRWENSQRYPLGFLVLTIVLYPAGYLLVRGVEFRYYLTAFGFLFVVLFLVLDWTVDGLRRRRGRGTPWVGFVLATLLVVGPTVSVLQLQKLTTLLTVPYGACLSRAAKAMAPYLRPPSLAHERTRTCSRTLARSRASGSSRRDRPQTR